MYTYIYICIHIHIHIYIHIGMGDLKVHKEDLKVFNDEISSKVGSFGDLTEERLACLIDQLAGSYPMYMYIFMSTYI
jgi:hypothetical protein